MMSVFSAFESGSLVHLMWLKFPRWCIKVVNIFFFSPLGIEYVAVLQYWAFQLTGVREGDEEQELMQRICLIGQLI